MAELTATVSETLVAVDSGLVETISASSSCLVADSAASELISSVELVSLSDTCSVSDSVSRQYLPSRELHSDLFAYDSGVIHSTIDAMGVTDGTRLYLHTPALSTEHLFVSELVEAEVIEDALTATDSTDADTGPLYTRSAADLLLVTETGQAELSAEPISVADSSARMETFGRTVGDSVSTSDSVSRATTTVRSVSDTCVATDTVARAASSVRPLADTLTVSDQASRATASVRPISDSVSVTDGVTRTESLARACSDTSAVSDDVLAEKFVSVIERSVEDAVSVSDQVTRAGAFGRSMTDTAVSSDTIGRTATFGRLLAEASVASDSTLRGSVFEAQGWSTIYANDGSSQGTLLHDLGNGSIGYDGAIEPSVANGVDGNWWAGDVHNAPVAYTAVAPDGPYQCTTCITDFATTTANCEAGLTAWNDRNNAVHAAVLWNGISTYGIDMAKIVDDVASTLSWAPISSKPSAGTPLRLKFVYLPSTGYLEIWRVGCGAATWTRIYNASSPIGAPARFGVFAKNWTTYPAVFGSFDYLHIEEYDDPQEVAEVTDEDKRTADFLRRPIYPQVVIYVDFDE